MDLDIPAIEKKWKDLWEKNNIYSYNPEVRDREKWFSIDTPPPTVSGKVHLGHAFSYPQQDFIARYKRMLGYNVYYPFGFDDNGLPTERYTEKSLGIKGEKMDPGRFIELCHQEASKARESMLQVYVDLGLSANFQDAYTTSSEISTRLSQLMFLDLVEKNKVYRTEAPVIRCPVCLTAISQIEMKDSERNTDFVYVKFGKLTIATTRPELIGACVAVMVNPADKRYKNLIGSTTTVPIYSHDVPIIGDESIAMDKGTGAEMLCTFGDQNDMNLWRKYSPGTRIILTENGHLNEKAGFLEGLGIVEARKKIIAELESRGLIEKRERIRHSVNVHERCDTPVEIGISKQWFVKCLDSKEELKEFSEKIIWIPEHMRARLNNWIDGLKWDWCISRQRFLGIPFPVWYCNSCGNTIFARPEELPVDPRFESSTRSCASCGSTDISPETDVMDTWATSSLTPRLSTEPYGLFDLLYPSDIRFQGHDIISFWAFTTILRSKYHYDVIPWKQIYINGIVSDSEGRKMSKSKGNIVDPEFFLGEYGADAVRYWASTVIPGDDAYVREQDFVRGRKIVIKLFNAAKLVNMLTGSRVVKEFTSYPKFPVNAWIISKLNETVTKYRSYMDDYQVSRARGELDNFFWNTYCDNYLEISKAILKEESSVGTETASEVVNICNFSLIQILILYAPILPFITEELYQSNPLKQKPSIHIESMPEPSKVDNVTKDVEEVDYIIDLLTRIRALKSSMKLSMNARIESITLAGNVVLINKYASVLKTVMNIGNLNAVQSETAGASII
jgi:valyl-tRNA synthetase